MLLRYSMLVTLSHCAIFECNYNHVNWEYVGDHVYACQANVIHSGSEFNLENVKGFHQARRSNFDVVFLAVNDQVASVIPSNIDKFFPNIQGIKWKNTNLLSISANNLKQFPNLKALSLARNKLVTIDSDLFKFTPYIKWISFSNNLIEDVGANLLKGLADLQFVSFEENPCVNLRASGPIEIEKLTLKLAGCARVSTTTVKINDGNERDPKSLQDNDLVDEKIVDLENKFIRQGEIIASFEERILELESKIKEISLNMTLDSSES